MEGKTIQYYTVLYHPYHRILHRTIPSVPYNITPYYTICTTQYCTLQYHPKHNEQFYNILLMCQNLYGGTHLGAVYWHLNIVLLSNLSFWSVTNTTNVKTQERTCVKVKVETYMWTIKDEMLLQVLIRHIKSKVTMLHFLLHCSALRAGKILIQWTRTFLVASLCVTWASQCVTELSHFCAFVRKTVKDPLSPAAPCDASRILKYICPSTISQFCSTKF